MSILKNVLRKAYVTYIMIASSLLISSYTKLAAVRNENAFRINFPNYLNEINSRSSGLSPLVSFRMGKRQQWEI